MNVTQNETNSQIIVTTSLDELRSQINSNHQQALRLANASVEYALKCGQGLFDAKQRLLHGQWLPWVEKNCPEVSVRQTQKYMRLAENWTLIKAAREDCPEEISSLNGALALIANPKAEPNTTCGAHLDAATDNEFDSESELITYVNAVVERETKARQQLGALLCEIRDREIFRKTHNSIHDYAAACLNVPRDDVDELLAISDEVEPDNSTN
jgi:hypothetical protein